MNKKKLLELKERAEAIKKAAKIHQVEVESFNQAVYEFFKLDPKAEFNLVNFAIKVLDMTKEKDGEENG